MELKRISILLIFVILSTNGNTQHLNLHSKNVFLLGSSLGTADSRLDFQHPIFIIFPKNTIERDHDKFEIEFFGMLQRRIIQKSGFTFLLGSGYSLNIYKFGLPVSKDYFLTFMHPGLNNTYYKHSLIFNTEFHQNVPKIFGKDLELVGSLNPYISFYKAVRLENSGGVISWGLEFSEIEGMIGLNLEISNRLNLLLQGRAFQLSFRDDALANNGKELDFYNPLKLRIALGREF